MSILLENRTPPGGDFHRTCDFMYKFLPQGRCVAVLVRQFRAKSKIGTPIRYRLKAIAQLHCSITKERTKQDVQEETGTAS